jgi:hypothetical protein
MQSQSSHLTVDQRIAALADEYAIALQSQMDARVLEMETDDNAHYLIYRVLGVTIEEGRLIDIYQNKGRFLYKYAGTFLEKAAKICFLGVFPDSKSFRIPNSLGQRPKTFEIDCLVGEDALEIKWRDATTDGDHITKEHTRIRSIVAAGYRPVRVMFYYPNRGQAIKIQQALETLYKGVDGEYYFGDDAWAYIMRRTGVDLESILQNIADSRTREA